MMYDELKKLIIEHSHPELAKEDGMVYQVWNDGEVTLQKSGSLLWQRNLHQVDVPLGGGLNVSLFPEKFNNEKNSYIYTTQEGAQIVRKMVGEVMKKLIDHRLAMSDIINEVTIKPKDQTDGQVQGNN